MDSASAIIVAVSLAFIMFGMGLSLTINDFKRIFQQPKAVFIGLVNQLILLPLVGFALVSLLPLQPEVAIGVMILVACPGGATSNLISHLAKGDTALSVTLTAVSSLVTIISIPLIIKFSLERFQGTSQEVSLDVLQTVGQLLMIVIIPVSIGMTIRAKAAALAMKSDRAVRIASGFLLTLIIVGLIIKERENIPPYFQQAGLPCLLLCLITMALGYFSSRAFKLKLKQAISISIESGIQNSGLAITIATVSLGSSELGIAAAIYTLIMYLVTFTIIFLTRKSIAASLG